MRDCSNSSVLAMELLQSCFEPSIYSKQQQWRRHSFEWASVLGDHLLNQLRLQSYNIVHFATSGRRTWFFFFKIVQWEFSCNIPMLAISIDDVTETLITRLLQFQWRHKAPPWHGWEHGRLAANRNLLLRLLPTEFRRELADDLIYDPHRACPHRCRSDDL